MIIKSFTFHFNWFSDQSWLKKYQNILYLFCSELRSDYDLGYKYTRTVGIRLNLRFFVFWSWGYCPSLIVFLIQKCMGDLFKYDENVHNLIKSYSKLVLVKKNEYEMKAWCLLLTAGLWS